MIGILHRDQGGADPPPGRVGLAARQHPAGGPLQQAAQVAETPLVHNRPQVGAGERIAAIETLKLPLERRHQGLADLGHHQEVVGGHAGLAGIEALAPGQPPRRDLEVGVSQHDGGTLAAQFQGHRRELPGGGGHHKRSHPFSAGEEDVVEAFLQQRGRHLAIAEHHLHRFRGEMAGNQAGDQLGGARGVLGGLEHSRVAGRQGAHQGMEAQLEGVVPGAENQHAAQGFAHHPGAGRLGPGRQADPLRLHPAGQVAAAVG